MAYNHGSFRKLKASIDWQRYGVKPVSLGAFMKRNFKRRNKQFEMEQIRLYVIGNHYEDTLKRIAPRNATPRKKVRPRWPGWKVELWADRQWRADLFKNHEHHAEFNPPHPG